MNMALNFGAGIAAGPDGKAWVTVQFATGAGLTTLMLNPDEADQFADAMAASVKQATQQAKQANGGLILPNGAGQLAVPVPPAGPANGNGQPR